MVSVEAHNVGKEGNGVYCWGALKGSVVTHKKETKWRLFLGLGRVGLG